MKNDVVSLMSEDRYWSWTRLLGVDRTAATRKRSSPAPATPSGRGGVLDLMRETGDRVDRELNTEERLKDAFASCKSKYSRLSFTADDASNMMRMVKARTSLAKIAEHYRCSPASIQNTLDAHYPNRPRRRGRRPYKFASKEAAAMAKRRDEGASYYRIAREFDCTAPTVKRAISMWRARR